MPDDVWAILEPILPAPATNRECLHALLSVLVSGIAWEMLPWCLPTYKTVQRRLKGWHRQDAFLTGWKELAGRYQQFHVINWDQIPLDGFKTPAKMGARRRGHLRSIVHQTGRGADEHGCPETANQLYTRTVMSRTRQCDSQNYGTRAALCAAPVRDGERRRGERTGSAPRANCRSWALDKPAPQAPAEGRPPGGRGWFTERWMAQGTYSGALVGNTAGQPGTTYTGAKYAAASLWYIPFRNTSLGLEYLCGQWKNLTGQLADANRINMLAQSNF